MHNQSASAFGEAYCDTSRVKFAVLEILMFMRVCKLSKYMHAFNDADIREFTGDLRELCV